MDLNSVSMGRDNDMATDYLDNRLRYSISLIAELF